ncbi:MAG: S9 family peptidase [Candidatus Aminicenantes bacterium]|nr:S9 family peptidase [Candidatus Aminicenantes bacterium]
MNLNEKKYHNRFIFFASIFLLFVMFPALGDQFVPSPVAGEDKEQKLEALTPEQTLKIRTVNDLQISPEGKFIAMTVSEPIKESDRDVNIWLYNLNDNTFFLFAASEKRDFFPRWAPDGKKIAFLSNRSGKTQIHVIPIDGGEAEQFTNFKTNISSFQWSPGGKRIVFFAGEPETEEEKKKKEEKNDARVEDREDKPSRLWIFDIDGKDVRQLTKGDWRISSYEWLPDGDHLIVSATDSKRHELLTDRLYRINLKYGGLEDVAEPALPFSHVRIDPGGERIAYLGTPADGPIAHDLFVMDLEEKKPVNKTRKSLDRPVRSFKWEKNGDIFFQCEDGFKTRLGRIHSNGQLEYIPAFEVDPSGSFAIGPDYVAYVGQTAIHMPELWISREPGKAEQVTHLNKEWMGIELIKPEIVSYTSFDGRQIGAALYKPESLNTGFRVPLIVLIHGGPAGRWSDRFNAWAQLLVRKGFAVLLPNIRGSTGYGQDFVAANRRDWGGSDFRDVMAGIDYLISEGIADPEKLGIGGWSYGGYMAAWAVTQTDRFKAAVSGAPMTDLAGEYGTEEAGINPYDTWYMGTPYENLELFQDRSPVTYIKRVKTPTLLLSGEKDVIDPIGQSQQFYRGLKRYGVETEFVIYPREGHGIREEKHRIDLLKRIIGWFEKHIIIS